MILFSDKILSSEFFATDVDDKDKMWKAASILEKSQFR